MNKKLKTLNINCGKYGVLIINIDYQTNEIYFGYNDEFRKKCNIKEKTFKIVFGPEKEAYSRIIEKINEFEIKLEL